MHEMQLCQNTLIPIYYTQLARIDIPYPCKGFQFLTLENDSLAQYEHAKEVSFIILFTNEYIPSIKEYDSTCNTTTLILRNWKATLTPSV
jgi:hypothetical protein